LKGSTALKIILEWLKMVAKLPKLLPRRGKVQEAEPTPGELTELDKILGRKIQQRQAKRGSPVDTSKGGPNMPRRQPCPTCHRPSKRTKKTAGGARYKCPTHGDFFVRAPGL